MVLLTRTGHRINRYCSMSDFPLFKMAVVRHLRFLKVGNFKFRSSSEAQYATSCQISRRLVELFQRYGLFSIFKMAAVRHLGFSKIILTSGPPRRANMRHRAKFREDRSNRSEDMADFRFSRWQPSAILGFQKLEFLTVVGICWFNGVLPHWSRGVT